MAKTYVLDTNVLLHSAKALDSFQDNLVVIPMAVIEELDKFKKNQDELGRNSRQVVRMIDKLRGEGRLSEGVPLHNAAGGKPSGKLMILTGEGEMPEKMDMSIADNRILQVAYMLLKRAKREDSVTLITKDLNLRLRADGLGIPVQDFECQTVKFDELYSGTSETEVDPQTIDDFYKNKSIEVPNGLALHPNEFLTMKSGTKSAIGIFRGGKLVMPHELPGDNVWNVKPRSREQRIALQLLTDPAIQVVTLVGQAGSGKTLLALAAALQQVLRDAVFENILVSRPIIPLGKDIGYLPGDKNEKLSVWMQPIYDNLDYLLHTEKRGESVKRKVDELIRTGKLELEALTYIRGRSIPHQFVIIDEAQNLTPHEVKTIVSRAGEDTKMVLTGDPEQIDNPYLDASSNGLSYIVERFKDLPLHGHITLRKSERSELAAAAAEYL